MAQRKGNSSGRSSSGSSRSSRSNSSGRTTSRSRNSSGSRDRTTKTKAAIQKENAAIKRKRQSVAVILFACAILMFVLVVFPGIGGTFSVVIKGLFGVSGIIWCFLLFYLSVLLALDKPDSKIGVKLTQATFAVLLLSSFVYMVMPVSKELVGKDLIEVIGKLYVHGTNMNGTGLIGGIFGAGMVAIFGRVLSMIIVLLAAFVLIMLLTQTGLIQLFKSVSKPVKSAAERAHERAAERLAAREAMRERDPDDDYDDYDDYNDFRDEFIENQAKKKKRARFEIDVPFDDSEDVPYDEFENESGQEDSEEEGSDFQAAPYMRPRFKRGANDDENNSDKRAESGKKKNSRVADDVVQELARSQQRTAAKKKSSTASANETDGAAAADINDDDFEALIQKVAGTKSKKQRVEEIARETADFAREVQQMQTGEAPANEYKFPPLDLLVKTDNSDDGDIRAELKNNAERLVETLGEYNVAASVVDISRGPAVTRYELKPAPGVKISKITSLTNDIALRLAAPAVRIEAPIPGKAAVGIEIPNQNRSLVRIRELIDSEQFRSAKSPVTVAIGKDIEGNIILADLAKMPHLLIAGSTGMGKSVCINSMLVSLIYKSSPADVRLIMVDPKKVELDVYNGIPHLLVPVVCDPKKAAGALQWAVGEMDKRYALLNEHGVRNIDGYNALAAKNGDMEKMSRIVIVIDEMADLMSTSPKEVENAIARLAAMARAAGMHMVLATQRPSVDVITGTIKNNIPSRIAFAVSSQIDSRTILDESGAEGLIGKGDMLFNPVGVPKPKRVQGCLVEDQEVEDAVGFVKQNCAAEYDDSIAREIERNVAEAADNKSGAMSAEDVGSRDEDPLYLKAIEVVIEAGQASTSMLQRRLGVGYARAGRLIDQLAEHGVIGPFEGSKPRQVLMTRQQFLEMTMSRETPAANEKPSSNQLSILSMYADDDDEDNYSAADSDDDFDPITF